MTDIYARRFPKLLTAGPGMVAFQRTQNERLGYGQILDIDRDAKLSPGGEWAARAARPLSVQTLSGDKYAVQGWGTRTPRTNLMALLAEQHPGLGANLSNALLMCGDTECVAGVLAPGAKRRLFVGELDLDAPGVVTLLWRGQTQSGKPAALTNTALPSPSHGSVSPEGNGSGLESYV